MMNSNRFVLTLLLVAAGASFASAQSGGNYTIKDATLEGTAHEASGDNFAVKVRIGQGLAGPSLSGGNFSVSGGFFPAPPSPPSAPPAAPIGLVAVSVLRDRVQLAWEDRSLDETGFILERCDGNGRCPKWSLLSVTGPNVATFSDTTVQIGTVYQYRVYAFNAAGNSPISNIVTAKIPKR